MQDGTQQLHMAHGIVLQQHIEVYTEEYVKAIKEDVEIAPVVPPETNQQAGSLKQQTLACQ